MDCTGGGGTPVSNVSRQLLKALVGIINDSTNQ
jgi:hypothetical protein